MTRPPCPDCGTVHSPNSATVVAGTRFIHGPLRYRSRHDRQAPPRWTREEAERDFCRAMQAWRNEGTRA